MKTQQFITLTLILGLALGCGLQQKALENRQAQEASTTSNNNAPTSGGSGGTAPVDLATGLIMQFSFEEGGGTATDYALDNDGVVSGGVDVLGKKGRAILFNNYLDKVTVPFTPYYNFTRVTVSTWIYWNGSTGYDQRIFQRSSNGAGTNSVYNLRLDGSARVVIDMTISGSNVSFNTSSPVSVGRWIHLAYTYDGNRISFYKDGQFAGSLVALGNIGGYPLSNSITLGNAGEAIRPFNGAIDEFYIYNRAMSDAEITALYQLKK
jgi:hypothetical protein